MSRLPNLSRLARYTALAGVGAFVLLDLANGDGFSFGLSYLACAVLTEGLAGGSCTANGVAAGLIPSLLFTAALVAASAAYTRSLIEIAAGTRLAAAIVRRPDLPSSSLRDRVRRAARILAERRRPVPDRASEAIDALLTPIAGEGVRVIRPEPVRPVTTMPWQAREVQRTHTTGNTDRWATPRDDEETNA
jgi:hypothetical protein